MNTVKESISYNKFDDLIAGMNEDQVRLLLKVLIIEELKWIKRMSLFQQANYSNKYGYITINEYVHKLKRDSEIINETSLIKNRSKLKIKLDLVNQNNKILLNIKEFIKKLR